MSDGYKKSMGGVMLASKIGVCSQVFVTWEQLAQRKCENLV